MATQIMMERMMTSVGDVFRQFIPSERGESLDEQIYPWNVDGLKQKVESPLSMDELNPRTIANILSMRAVEMQHWTDYHAYAKMVMDQNLKKQLNMIAWAEHMHFLMLQSLLPTPNVPSQDVIASELSLIMNYDMCIRDEPNDSVKNAFQHIRQDHVQHAQYAAQQLQNQGADINRMTGGMDMSGGRALNQQFMKPDSTIWQGQYNGVYNKGDVDARTLINIDQSLAGEVAAWNGYACAMTFEKNNDVKLNFGAFCTVENQHVSILGSLRDPSETLLERSLLHEQVEVQNYRQMMESETNPKARKVFEHLYREDLEQARLFGDIAK